MTSKLLRFGATWVSHQKCAIIVHEDLLDLTLGCLINIFLVPCNESFANCLTNGIQLGSVTTTLHTDADVHLTVPVGTKEQDRLPNLKSERLWLHQLNWHTIDLDEPFALLHECGPAFFHDASLSSHTRPFSFPM